jgi:arylsulfatase
MAVHAAMVDRMDQGIGKIIEKLKQLGEYENTLILFLMIMEPLMNVAISRDSTDLVNERRCTIDYDPVQPGPETTWGYIGDAWASAANTPFRFWKKSRMKVVYVPLL